MEFLPFTHALRAVRAGLAGDAWGGVIAAAGLERLAALLRAAIAKATFTLTIRLEVASGGISLTG